jgi:hypothetical protein
MEDEEEPAEAGAASVSGTDAADLTEPDTNA